MLQLLLSLLDFVRQEVLLLFSRLVSLRHVLQPIIQLLGLLLLRHYNVLVPLSFLQELSALIDVFSNDVISDFVHAPAVDCLLFNLRVDLLVDERRLVLDLLELSCLILEFFLQLVYDFLFVP